MKEGLLHFSNLGFQGEWRGRGVKKKVFVTDPSLGRKKN